MKIIINVKGQVIISKIKWYRTKSNKLTLAQNDGEILDFLDPMEAFLMHSWQHIGDYFELQTDIHIKINKDKKNIKSNIQMGKTLCYYINHIFPLLDKDYLFVKCKKQCCLEYI